MKRWTYVRTNAYRSLQCKIDERLDYLGSALCKDFNVLRRTFITAGDNESFFFFRNLGEVP